MKANETNASKEQQLQASQATKETDTEGQVVDKKLSGPNRPST